MGCVGKDNYAEIMQAKAEEVGLNTLYQVDPNDTTGKCVVLVTGKDRYFIYISITKLNPLLIFIDSIQRSLITYQGAAKKFTLEHLEQNWSTVLKAKFFYIPVN